ITERMRLQIITALSYKFNHRWLQPILDFSIPPNQIYETVPAWQLLEESDTFLQSRSLKNLQQSIIIIAPGGYDEAGIAANGEDNFPLPAAVAYWRNQQKSQDKRGFTGGEAHAYMTYHFLTHRLVIPIPDIWMILIAALMGKGLSLMLIQDKQRWFLITSGLTIFYSFLSLQLYISTALLLPWVLPSTTFWFYLLPQLKSKNNV
ncbi:MAG: histidine kinase, partial [Cyanobacteria bacterium P01_H01_bin.150]